MKRYLLVLLLAFILLINTVVVLAQDDICTREAVAGSYAQAIAAGTDLNQWYQNTYANSGCPQEVLSFASSLANTQMPANTPTNQPTQSEDAPPPGLKLPEPGTYLYTNGKLVQLVSSKVPDLSDLPQTSNVFPSILYWSKDTSNNSVFPVNTVTYFTGGIGVSLASAAGHVLITVVYPNTPAFNTGLQYGDRIVSVDGIQVGDSVDQATKLLIGEIGIPVTIAILRGTQSFTVSIVRGPSVTPQFSTWPYDAWDATTVVLKPDKALEHGMYCIGEGCFRVVPEDTNLNVTSPIQIGDLISITAENARNVQQVALLDLRKNEEFGNGIDGIAFSTDGKQLAYSTNSGYVVVWDIGKQAQIKSTWRATQGNANSVAFSRDGSRLVTAHSGGSVGIWDPTTGSQILLLRASMGMMIDAAFSPDGKMVAAGSNDNNVYLWDANTGKSLSVLAGHTAAVFSVVFSPDGKKLLSGSSDNTIRFWDTKTFSPVGMLQGHNNWVLSLDYNKDGSKLASGDYGGGIRVWEGENSIELKGHSSYIQGVKFGADGTILASAGGDGTVRIWNVSIGEQLTSLSTNSRIESLAFSPDGKIIASGGEDGTVKLWGISNTTSTTNSQHLSQINLSNVIITTQESGDFYYELADGCKIGSSPGEYVNHVVYSEAYVVHSTQGCNGYRVEVVSKGHPECQLEIDVYDRSGTKHPYDLASQITNPTCDNTIVASYDLNPLIFHFYSDPTNQLSLLAPMGETPLIWDIVNAVSSIVGVASDLANLPPDQVTANVRLSSINHERFLELVGKQNGEVIFRQAFSCKDVNCGIA